MKFVKKTKTKKLLFLSVRFWRKSPNTFKSRMRRYMLPKASSWQIPLREDFELYLFSPDLKVSKKKMSVVLFGTGQREFNSWVVFVNCIPTISRLSPAFFLKACLSCFCTVQISGLFSILVTVFFGGSEGILY